MSSLIPRRGFRWLLCEHPWCTRRATCKPRAGNAWAETCREHRAWGGSVATMRADGEEYDARRVNGCIPVKEDS